MNDFKLLRGDAWDKCPHLKFCRRLSVVMPHSETRMVTGDDNRNTVKENAGQRYSHDCTTTPRSWQGSQKTVVLSAHRGLAAKAVEIWPRLEAASAAAYTERTKNVTKTVETVTVICSRTFLICRPASVALLVTPE